MLFRSDNWFFSGGANLLRRNNLPQYLKAFIWDEMELIVDINPKFSYTGTQADYILPAAGWYEKPGIKYTMAYIPYVHYCGVAVQPLAESKDEFEIYWLLSREIERQAKTMDLPVFDGCGRGSSDWKTLHQRYSNHGDLGQKDAEKLVTEILRSSARAFGPISASIGRPEVTSVANACAPSGICRLSQARSRRCEMASVTTRKAVSERRVTVTSASIPPCAFSHWV